MVMGVGAGQSSSWDHPTTSQQRLNTRFLSSEQNCQRHGRSKKRFPPLACLVCWAVPATWTSWSVGGEDKAAKSPDLGMLKGDGFLVHPPSKTYSLLKSCGHPKPGAHRLQIILVRWCDAIGQPQNHRSGGLIVGTSDGGLTVGKQVKPWMNGILGLAVVGHTILSLT